MSDLPKPSDETTKRLYGRPMLQTLEVMPEQDRVPFLEHLERVAVETKDADLSLEILSFKVMQASLPEAFRLPMPQPPTTEPEPGK